MSNAKPMGHNGGPPLDEVQNPYGRDGYISAARAMRFHPIVGCGNEVKRADPSRGAWSRYEAWQDLIMECRYEAGKVNNGGVIMEIQPGQLLGAVSWLANRWNWTPKTVRVFLDTLEREGMITASRGTPTSTDQNSDRMQGCTDRGQQRGNQKGKQAAVLTITKYEIFQMWYKQQRLTEGQTSGPTKGEPGANEGQHLNKGIREYRNKTEESTPPDGAAPVQSPIEEKPKREYAKRLPNDWTLPKEWYDWALTKVVITEADIRREAENFRDYWVPLQGSRAMKPDWFATWRNWVRRNRRLRDVPTTASAETSQVDLVDELDRQQRELRETLLKRMRDGDA